MTHPPKPAVTAADLVPTIKNRWSSVIFNGKPLTEEQIYALFEAARWAPSSYNEQPWLYVYAQRGDDNRQVLEDLLLEGNAWAKQADVLMVCFAKETLDRNDKPNDAAEHDMGASNYAVTLQATHMGLATHQMGGFTKDKANEVLGVPDKFRPIAMMAVGYPGDPSQADEALKERDAAERSRKEQTEFVFRGSYSA